MATSSTIRVLADTTELIEMYRPAGLYLKPISVFNVSVALPQLREPSQSISNWDLMERLKKAIHPLQFASIKVSKSTMEFVRFEAEAASREQMKRLISSLDNSALKVIGFFETLKVKAAEAKVDFPTRHDWDSFFRDAENMNELRAGERPDTIYLGQLPLKWFLDAGASANPAMEATPSEYLLRRVFETFGEVRSVDIPVCDPFRRQMTKTGMRSAGFNYGSDTCFEAYVQYVEYISFVKAMDALRGMKLVQVSAGRAWAASLRVDFDRTKHMSDKAIRRRRVEREKLGELEKKRAAKEAAAEAALEEERSKMDDEAFQRRRQREEKRRVRALEKRRLREQLQITQNIALEERKLLVAQRKLVGIRLLTVLFQRIEQAAKSQTVKDLEKDLEAMITAERKAKAAKAAAKKPPPKVKPKTEPTAKVAKAGGKGKKKKQPEVIDLGEICSEHSDSKSSTDSEAERKKKVKTKKGGGGAIKIKKERRSRSLSQERTTNAGRSLDDYIQSQPKDRFKERSRSPKDRFGSVARDWGRAANEMGPPRGGSVRGSRRPSPSSSSESDDMESSFEVPTLRSKVVKRERVVRGLRTGQSQNQGARAALADLAGVPERKAVEGEDEERFPAVNFTRSAIPPRFGPGAALPKTSYDMEALPLNAMRRRQAPKSPPVEFGGGDPYELAVDGTLG